jgi:hypothetical protein
MYGVWTNLKGGNEGAACWNSLVVVTASVRDLCFSTSSSTPSLTLEVCADLENYIYVTEPSEVMEDISFVLRFTRSSTHKYMYYMGD